MKVHLIAIGGSVMHNVAMDLKDMGHDVSGSDDEIYEPSKSRLFEAGLLPKSVGWDPKRITDDIDLIILGKHAREGNPELQKAIELKIPIKSFPEFISEASKATKRICISGSHGKTTTTSMVMHALKYYSYDFDYLVGANLEGFDKMVKVSNADILVIEGDEYPSSCLDNKAKMLHYNPTVAVITGVAWDHVNIYKTYDDYLEIFDSFLTDLAPDASCFFYQDDESLLELILHGNYNCKLRSYLPFPTTEAGASTYKDQIYDISVFGVHNLANMKAAALACESIGIPIVDFLKAIKSFKGASKRLELIKDSTEIIIYKDFAHAPSKCKASCEAIKSKFPNRKRIGLLELHTFSSLTPSFIKEYKNTMDALDEAYVFFDPHAVRMKQMDALDPIFVHDAFNHSNLKVIQSASDLKFVLESLNHRDNSCFLLMSSGNVGGLNVSDILDIQ